MSSATLKTACVTVKWPRRSASTSWPLVQVRTKITSSSRLESSGGVEDVNKMFDKHQGKLLPREVRVSRAHLIRLSC